MMRKLARACLFVFIAVTVQGGTEESVSRISPAPQPWYADRELNLQVWGAYAFTADSYRNDGYLQADHAWGGGLAAKYFFNRYVGLGLEGYALVGTQSITYIENFVDIVTYPTIRDQRVVGAGMATITLRLPLGSSRFAPYIFGGAGLIAGGGKELSSEFISLLGTPPGTHPIRTYFSESETKAIGQIGGGVEIRVTPHIGLLNEFSWSMVDGRASNFGLVRSGLNFAF